MEEPTSPASLLDRFPGLSVVICLVIGLILRVVALLDLKRTLYFDYLLWDEKLFHIWAAKIADGSFQSTDIYEASPLPAYLMGLIYYLFSIDPTNIRIMNIGFGLLTCLMVYLIGKQLAGHKVGVVACLIACLYKPLIFYSIVPLKTSIGVFLFALTIYFFLATFKRVSWRSLFLLGLAAALLFNVRPNAGVLVPLMPLLILVCWNRQQTSRKTMATALAFYAIGIGVVAVSNCPEKLCGSESMGFESESVRFQPLSRQQPGKSRSLLSPCRIRKHVAVCARYSVYDRSKQEIGS